MSDLGVLWSQAGGSALENFTTAALRNAIARDPRPMIAALADLMWEEASPLPSIDRLAPTIQVGLRAPSLVARSVMPPGQLDLVLECMNGNDLVATAWVEVKVDAGEHGPQFEVYEKHWPRLHPNEPMRLCLLGNAELTPRREDGSIIPIAWLPWARLISAITTTDAADPSWVDLAAFLRERHVGLPADPALPLEGLDGIVDVLWELNAAQRAERPSERFAWWPGKAALRKNVRIHQESLREGLVTTGAGSVYGMAAPDGEWRWIVAVDIRESKQRGFGESGLSQYLVTGHLGAEWEYRPGARWALQRTAPRAEYQGPEAIAWLASGLDDLRRVGFFRPPEGDVTDPGNRRFLGVVEVDSGTIVVGDPAYLLAPPTEVLPSLHDLFQAAPDEMAQQLGPVPVLLVGHFGGDGTYPVFGELDDQGGLVRVVIEFDMPAE